MPYIIRVPGIPRPYITNDPRIYLDGLNIFRWDCEARPFSDSYCKMLRREEEARFEGEKRCEQLIQHWNNELQQRRWREVAGLSTVGSFTLSRKPSLASPVGMFSKDTKRDSVIGVLVEVKEIHVDELD